MIYFDNKTGISFHLPNGWHKDEHNLILTFYGADGGLGKNYQIIQLKIGSILSQYISQKNREIYLSEPEAQVLQGKVGNEKNVVILKRTNESEISVVRDGIHYIICHSNDNETLTAIDTLCNTFLFPVSQNDLEIFLIQPINANCC